MRNKFYLLVLLFSVMLLLGACGGAAPAVEQAKEKAEDAAAEVKEAAEGAADQAQEAVEEAATAVGDAVEEATSSETPEEDPLGNIVVASGDPIRLASALVIAGPNATLGIDSQTGVEVAIKERGDVAGHPVELIPEDDGCSAEGGQTAATKIASDDSVAAVVGHSCSSSCTPAAPIYNDAGLTMISPSCTAPALTGPDHVPSFLRTAHNDNVQGRVMAEFVFNELGLTTAATIHDGSPYAEQLQQVFADTFTELGGTITAQEAVNVGDTDMRPVLTSIATGSPEFLYFPVFIAEGGFITSQAKEVAGLEDTILAGADGMISPDFVSAAGEAAEGMYVSGPNLTFSGATYDQFLADYVEILGEEPVSAFHAHAFDATNMIFDAIEAVATTDADGNTVIGKQALRDALYATSGLEGITGTISCQENGDCADPEIVVSQIQGGEYVPVFGGAMAAEGEEAMEGDATEEAMMEATEEATAEATAEATEEAMAAGEAMAMPECTELTPVNLQLQWVAQSQFAGYYAAVAEGFYNDFCLDVTILEGAVDIVPQQVVASGQAEFGIAWVPKVLASREEGANLVNIAQVFQRSGTLEVSWADNPVATIDDMAGKRIGTWGFGNEHELFAAMRLAGLDPNNPDDVEIIQQSFDMLALLNRELDAAEAMTYNEYAQVLEAVNPDTGELYQPEDLVVINFNDVGTAMLQDHVFVDGDWLAEEGNEELAVNFLAATFMGWQFCRDNFDACVQHVLDAGPTLGESHMQWQLNEINKLIWPSPDGIGIMDQALWDQTVEVSVDGGVITEPPGDDAFRTDLALEAHKYLNGDVTGESFSPIVVELREGGE
ncbi:MAG: ABC transporter substrate-binding protein [Anaerolineales bacterium]|nr:ABC transporter substrate-binding protein [Anaerolineales bacterium]